MAYRGYPPGLIAALIALPALAQTDGDSIALRLHGLDAPEKAQVCEDGRRAGEEAHAFLARLMAGKRLSVELLGKDRNGRDVSRVHADGVDLAAAMIRAGMGWAYVQFSRDYVDLERQAKSENLGVHAHGCLPAWEWRAQQRR